VAQSAAPNTEPAKGFESLLARAQSHDLAAFQELYRLTREEAARALGHLVDADQIERAIEQTYLALLSPRRSPALAGSFRSLFQKAVARAALDQRRFRRSAHAGALHGCLHLLSPRQRSVFVLGEILGSTRAEIAAATGLRTEQVGEQLLSARRAIAAAVRKSEGLPLTPHDVGRLWAHAARELDAEDEALLTAHLEDCPDCRDDLALVESLRAAAVGSAAKVADVPAAEIEQRLARRFEKHDASAAGLQGRKSWMLPPAAAAVVVLALLGLRALPAAPTEAAPSLAPTAEAAPQQAPATPTPTAVEAKADEGAVGAEDEPPAPIEPLRASSSGLAVVELSGSSRLGLEGDSRVRLLNGSGIRLERGRAVVQASGTVEVSTGGFSVRGSASHFLVAQVRGGVEVAVARGRVHVERPNALPMIVNAGQRVVFSRSSTRTTRTELTARDRALLEQLTSAARAVRRAPPAA
jgi:RNA polymerase sigma-70 factor (ECF subfamily)